LGFRFVEETRDGRSLENTEKEHQSNHEAVASARGQPAMRPRRVGPCAAASFSACRWPSLCAFAPPKLDASEYKFVTILDSAAMNFHFTDMRADVKDIRADATRLDMGLSKLEGYFLGRRRRSSIMETPRQSKLLREPNEKE
jgi:hypothetical protein